MIGSQRALASETVTISFLALDSNGAAITGASDFTIAITRSSDGARLDFSDSTFGGTITTGTATLVEQDATNHAGLYSYDLDLSAITNHATSTDYFQVSIGETGSDLLTKPIGEIVVNPPDLIAAAYDGKIWVDANNGSAGAQLGINGTKTNPTTTMASVDTLASATGFTDVMVAGTVTLNASTYTDYSFTGYSFGGTIGLNSKTPIRCLFHNVTLTGACGTAANVSFQAVDCYCTTITSLPTSDFRRCIVDGSWSLRAAAVGLVNFLDCMDGASSLGSFALTTTGASTTRLQFANFGGKLTLAGADAATILVEISGTGADVTLTSNSAGTITIRGVNAVSDDGSGATVTTTSNIEPQDILILRGLLLGNGYLDNVILDGNGFMTSGRLRIFDTATNHALATNGGSETTGLLATITLAGTASSSYPTIPVVASGSLTKVTT